MRPAGTLLFSRAFHPLERLFPWWFHSQERTTDEEDSQDRQEGPGRGRLSQELQGPGVGLSHYILMDKKAK